MKITKSDIKKIIQEETKNVLDELWMEGEWGSDEDSPERRARVADIKREMHNLKTPKAGEMSWKDWKLRLETAKAVIMARKGLPHIDALSDTDKSNARHDARYGLSPAQQDKIRQMTRERGEIDVEFRPGRKMTSDAWAQFTDDERTSYMDAEADFDNAAEDAQAAAAQARKKIQVNPKTKKPRLTRKDMDNIRMGRKDASFRETDEYKASLAQRDARRDWVGRHRKGYKWQEEPQARIDRNRPKFKAAREKFLSKATPEQLAKDKAALAQAVAMNPPTSIAKEEPPPLKEGKPIGTETVVGTKTRTYDTKTGKMTKCVQTGDMKCPPKSESMELDETDTSCAGVQDIDQRRRCEIARAENRSVSSKNEGRTRKKNAPDFDISMKELEKLIR